ncbi:MAG: hypothetical protein COV32_03255 [Candidatus Yonathbacteria bacterium CG10_big_fil_rev_8_21_14_0_10_43_136]|uniref:Uncharacterized protein n=2 Tax=Parcubacteria group TaxID=1794811 RepID=A0A2M7Q5H7_9BACT|nr:MAG: hypothetical protein AUK15_00910 [Candidatus Nomurabacteria bacterium CG2_30_43_9]PIQ36124.1 MAG: hypothetical protein COW60_00200 [Candidatus Yonathbacteria bacterium CG17_big_fil_post_rev_8_21_14_2_50_43_9]PIR40465.1 MAG: hypothetical protein COV32_03255 [Candidatus Yonathbacteria bacterium CG10_big_fil_rev_8_21_14_0_10_43_136]PIX56997.1 MAG: hypothetical protein COZ48_02970 [Candidatus Yonathbacteria bacterium CG_4_10_14_3_um_filter_43_12]PIY58696.1 MAG: hypothetical protein COY98_00
MNKKSFALVAVVIGVSFLGLEAYLDRPTVEVSVDTGHCVRAYGPNGPMTCEEAMSGSHEQVPVGSKKKFSRTITW